MRDIMGWSRAALFLWATWSLAGVCASRTESDPDAPVPPGSRFEVVGLRYTTESMGGRVQALAVKETAEEIRIELAADVLFDFDKSEIRPDAADTLAKAADILRSHSKQRATIEGHTDSKGASDYNQRLSERRAESVKRWLETREHLAVAMETRGWGERKPVASNAKPDGADDPEGRQKNRRVEIIIPKNKR
jgi:outer membrane protein OmpA-like peptidoglycan-associated protein